MEKGHNSATQGEVVVYLAARFDELGIEVFPAVRVQVSTQRFRVPDVTVVKRSQEQGEIFTNPPDLCIEILSQDDTMQYMLEKIDDYPNFVRLDHQPAKSKRTCRHARGHVRGEERRPRNE